MQRRQLRRRINRTPPFRRIGFQRLLIRGRDDDGGAVRLSASFAFGGQGGEVVEVGVFLAGFGDEGCVFGAVGARGGDGRGEGVGGCFRCCDGPGAELGLRAGGCCVARCGGGSFLRGGWCFRCCGRFGDERD